MHGAVFFLKVGEPVKEHSLKDISESLGIADRTLRRWSVLLEQNGYLFQMNKTTRVYTDTEYRLLSNVKKLTQGLSVDEAINMVLQNQQQETKDSSDIQGKIDELDRFINDFEGEIFWNGQKNSIELLMRKWAEIKSSLYLQGYGPKL